MRDNQSGEEGVGVGSEGAAVGDTPGGGGEETAASADDDEPLSVPVGRVTVGVVVDQRVGAAAISASSPPTPPPGPRLPPLPHLLPF